MARRKLSNREIIAIANSYARDNDAINTATLSTEYGVSRSTISKYLHYAIQNCLVSERTAKLIAKKAVRLDNEKRKELGYPKGDRVSSVYDGLLYDFYQRKAKIDELQTLKNRYVSLKHSLDVYDDVYTDDFPYTKEQLISEIHMISERITELENTLK